MSKYIFVTDNHAHLFTEFATPDSEYVNSRFKEQIDVLQKVYDLAKEHNATVIFGGDLFHKRGAVDVRVYNHVFKLIAENSEVMTLMLRGNHDSVTNSLHTESSIDMFDTLPNVVVYSKPSIEHLDGHSIVFIPYGDETEEMKDYLNNFKPVEGNTNILVGHFGVEGASTGMNSHRLSGAFGLGDLRPDVFEYILLGHYHRRQMLGENEKYIYGGSMMQQTFSDEGQTKGVHLISLGAKNTIEYIPIESKMFVTIHGANIPENVNELIENNYVRFIGSKDQAKALDKMQADTDLSNLRVMVEKDYKQEVRIGIDSSSSPEEVTRVYANQYFPDSVNEALECLREVN